MNRVPQVLTSLVYLSLSSLLVFAYSFFVPSLGHLQDFGIGERVLNLDLIAPWGMVVSAVLIAFLFLSGQTPGKQDRGLWEKALPLFYFVGLWAERSFYILQDRLTSAILGPLCLCSLWIPLFLCVVKSLSAEEVPLPEGPNLVQRTAGWGILFFWTAVFFSFSLQLIWSGYGTWGAIQALFFLGLSYLEYRKLLSTGFLEGTAAIVFSWAFLAAAGSYSVLWAVRSLGIL